MPPTSHIGETISNPSSSHTGARTPKYSSSTPIQAGRGRADIPSKTMTMTGSPVSFSTARKTPHTMVLEKTFTRGHYIKNVKRSHIKSNIKQIPEEDEGRHIPQVRSVKKRDSLLLKGQSDEMNATFNLDRSTIYKKAYDTLSGNSGSLSSSPRQKHSVSPPPSAEQSKIPLRTPILDHLLRKSLRKSFEQSEAEENPAEHLPHIKMALDWSSSKPSARPPASALTNQFKLLTSSGASFTNCPVTPPRTRDIRLESNGAEPQVAKL